MATDHPGEITDLLHRARNGDRQAEERLAALILPELGKIARTILSREYRGNTMETGDLVNQIYLRLAPGMKDYQDSLHFKAYAARAMHNHLIDRARKMIRREDHLGRREAFEEAERLLEAADGEESILRAIEYAELDRALEELRQMDERATNVAVLKSGGLTNDEIADYLGVSLATVKRDWTAARAFLLGRLG